jgi:hypothetical protein
MEFLDYYVFLSFDYSQENGDNALRCFIHACQKSRISMNALIADHNIQSGRDNAVNAANGIPFRSQSPLLLYRE